MTSKLRLILGLQLLTLAFLIAPLSGADQCQDPEGQMGQRTCRDCDVVEDLHTGKWRAKVQGESCNGWQWVYEGAADFQSPDYETEEDAEAQCTGLVWECNDWCTEWGQGFCVQGA